MGEMSIVGRRKEKEERSWWREKIELLRIRAFYFTSF
jgi:hypothetical protein